MKRVITVALVVLIATLVIPASIASSASAQTTDNSAFCAARLAVESARGKAQLVALEKLLTASPAPLVQPMTEIRDAFKKYGGNKGYEKSIDKIRVVDAYHFDNCPGTKVALTATDYQFAGIPATLPAGLTKFKLTNNAPKESHELGITKLTAAGAAMDPKELLSLPESKVGKFIDESSGSGTYAPAGATGYALVDLEPGTYIYACFLHVGGKKNGEPHFMEGMYGTFAVS